MKKLNIQKIKTNGDVPSPRFGHTFTMVSPTKAILFGGAVSVSGKFIITNETFLYDFVQSKWKKLNFTGLVPSQRAAHAASAISEMQMLIYGGAASGTQGLLKAQLYLLDLKKQPTWKIVDVVSKNNTPGQRYGHTMVFNKPYLIVFGGNSGNRAENDVWLLNILKGPYSWVKYEVNNNVAPCPRVYHSAAICEEGSAAGMMVIFGGRKQTKKDHNGSQRELTVSAMNDIWGFRKHKNGTWDWVQPPKSNIYNPICRYQHLVCFIGSSLVIMGGRSNNAEEAVSLIQCYDTQTAQWSKFQGISRYRHAITIFEKNKLYVHGGFEPEFISQPLQSMVSIDLSMLLSKQQSQNENKFIQTTQFANKQLPRQNQQKQQSQNENKFIQTTQFANKQLPRQNQQKQLRQIKDSERNINKNSRISNALDRSKVERQRDLTPSRIVNSSKSIRLSNQVVVARGQNNYLEIQRVPVNSLMQESKKLTNQPQDNITHNMNSIDLVDSVIHTLMPLNFKINPPTTIFPFKKDKVTKLLQEVIKILQKQTSLICVRAPCKIFGSLSGRYLDLLNLFQSFGFPDEHQMQSFQYVFLGNYVDKGFNSLETICLLFALKIKYPDHIRLLRGKHQDININRSCGLGEECALRLGQNINEGQSVFNLVNSAFELLPLAAAIDDKFLCVNSGIGAVKSIIDIKNIDRPVKVHQNQTVKDLLWSQENGNSLLKYQSEKSSQQYLDQFLQQNGLDMLINTKPCLPNGIAQEGAIISVSSVSNYPQKKSKAAMLKINKSLAVVPCILEGLMARKTVWIAQSIAKQTFPMTDNEKQLRKKIFNL